MRILYITTLYTRTNSSAAIRNNALVKGLTELGHEVYVKTIDWGRDESEFLNKENNGSICKYNLKTINKINHYKDSILKNNCFLHFLVPFIKSIIFFPDNTKEWIKSFKYENIHNNYDIVISSSDTKSSHFIAYNIKQKYPAIRWIQIWGDPWTYDINTPWYMKPITYFYEGKTFRLADKIVYVSELTSKLMKQKYCKYSSKMFFIPRSYYYQCNREISPNQNNIKILYTGTLAYGRDIGHMINAINIYNKDHSRKIELHIYGDNDFLSYNSMPYIKHHGAVDYSEMQQIYSNGDIFLFISNVGDTTQIPGKLYDYLGCSQPIICLCNIEQTQLITYLKSIPKCIVVNNNEQQISECLDGLDQAVINKHSGICIEYSPMTIAEQILE